MKLIAPVLGLALLAATGSVSAQGDVKEGAVKAYTCTGCHGIPGYNNVYPTYNVPKLGGQNYEYLVAALLEYQQGLRDHATMTIQAKSLTRQDIEDVSAYFASLKRD